MLVYRLRALWSAREGCGRIWKRSRGVMRSDRASGGFGLRFLTNIHFADMLQYLIYHAAAIDTSKEAIV